MTGLPSVTTDHSPTASSISTTHEQPATLSPLTPISPWPPILPPSPLPSRPSTPSSPPRTEVLHHDSVFGEQVRSTSHAPHSNETLPNATDIYASVAILGTYSLFAVYLAWAFLPSSWTESWLPERQWTLVVPCYLMVIVLLTYWTYGALVIFRTPAFSSSTCLTDPYSSIPTRPQIDGREGSEKQAEPYYWKYAGPEAIAEPVDLPIDLVGRVLYPPRPRKRR